MKDHVQKFIERHTELESLMALPENSSDPKKMEVLGREYSSLGKSIPAFKEYLEKLDALEQARWSRIQHQLALQEPTHSPTDDTLAIGGPRRGRFAIHLIDRAHLGYSSCGRPALHPASYSL